MSFPQAIVDAFAGPMALLQAAWQKISALEADNAAKDEKLKESEEAIKSKEEKLKRAESAQVRAEKELNAQLVSVSRTEFQLDSILGEIGLETDQREFQSSIASVLTRAAKLSNSNLNSKIFRREYQDAQEIQISSKLAHLLQLVMCGNPYFDYMNDEWVMKKLFIALIIAAHWEWTYTERSEEEHMLQKMLSVSQASLRKCGATDTYSKMVTTLHHIARAKVQDKREPEFKKRSKEIALLFMQTISPLYMAKSPTGEAVDIVSAKGIVHPDLKGFYIDLAKSLSKSLDFGNRMHRHKAPPKLFWIPFDSNWDDETMCAGNMEKGQIILTLIPGFVLEKGGWKYIRAQVYRTSNSPPENIPFKEAPLQLEVAKQSGTVYSDRKSHPSQVSQNNKRPAESMNGRPSKMARPNTAVSNEGDEEGEEVKETVVMDLDR